VTLVAIIVPSLLLVWALRRWITPVPWRIAFLFLALTLVFQHGAVFTSKLPVPVDDAARPYPWRGIFGEVTPRNGITNDAATLFLPWMHAAREELLHFRAPLWNRYSFSGYPLLGNAESAPFSPLFLATLLVKLPKQIVAMAGLKLFVALLFTFLLLKRERTGDAAAIFAAVAFAWSTAMTIFLYYSFASVICFLPAALFALLRAVDEPRKANVVLVALVVGTLLANGHPESVLHVAMGCAGMLVIEFATSKRAASGEQRAGVEARGASRSPLAARRSLSADRRDWLRRFRAPLAGVAFGLAISAPAWVPGLEQVFLSERMALMRSGQIVGGIPPTAAWAMVMQNGFGSPLRHNYSWWIGYGRVAFSYFGLLPLVVFLAAMVAPRTSGRDRAIGALAILLLLIAMDWTVVGHLFTRLPGLAHATNEKLRFVTLFLVVMVAAKALDTSKRWIALAAVPVVALAVYVFVSKRMLLQPVDLAGVATVVAFFVLPRRWAAVLVGLELFALNAGFNALVDARYYRPRLPIVGAIKARAGGEPFRVAGTGFTFSPNASALYELEDIRGSDPMGFDSYDRYLGRFTTLDGPEIARRVDDPGRPELDFLNVRFLLSDPGVVPGGRWREIYRGADGVLFENGSVLPRFFSRTARVEGIREQRPGEFVMRVSAPASATVVSSEVAAPGRTVRVNGRIVPVRLAEGAFISFQVPAGMSDIRLTHRPASYWVSVVVAALASLILAVRNRGIAFG